MKPTAQPVKMFSDDRGEFSPLLEATDPLLTKHKLAIKRTYYVHNHAAGTVRGFHFHKKEWKFFYIIAGAAKFIALDPEKPETTYTFTSSVRHAQMITIPPGYANGWVSLEQGTILLCCSTATTKESLADDARFDPYKWGDVWITKSR